MLTLLIYLPGVPNAGWVADDAVNLERHAADGDWLGEWSAPTYAHAGGERGHIWRPVPATIQNLVGGTFGRTGSVFKALNLLVHLVNLGLILGIGSRLLKPRLDPAGVRRVTVIAATLWVVHPTLPEAVCWSSDLYDLCAASACLVLLAVILGGGAMVRKTLACGVCLLVASLCKESAVVAVGLVGPIAFLESIGASMRKRLVDAAILTLGALAGAMIYLAWHHQVTVESYGTALGQSSFLAVPNAYLSTIGWLVYVPARAAMAHLFRPDVWLEAAVGAGVLFTLVALAIGSWKTGGRAVAQGCVAWMVMAIPSGVGVPLIGVQPLRYTYVGLALATLLFMRAGIGIAPKRRVWFWLIASVWVVSGLARTIPRVGDWHDNGTLWAAELEIEPDNPYAQGGLARYLLAQGEVAAGLETWTNAVSTVPNGIRVFDRQNERYLLAMAAYLYNRPQLAHEQTTIMIAELEAMGRPIPQNAWCLVADSLDSMDRHEEAVIPAKACEGNSRGESKSIPRGDAR